MGCITKTIARLLFVTFLISSAYLYLEKPNNYIDTFQSQYAQLYRVANKYIPGTFPAAQTLDWTFIVKFFGLFQGLIALLIVFGDSLGGILLFLTLFTSGLLNYAQDLTGICQWQANRQVQFAQFVFLLGASMAMICTGRTKKVASQKVQN